jgi:hypothetical protein
LCRGLDISLRQNLRKTRHCLTESHAENESGYHVLPDQAFLMKFPQKFILLWRSNGCGTPDDHRAPHKYGGNNIILLTKTF